MCHVSHVALTKMHATCPRVERTAESLLVDIVLRSMYMTDRTEYS